MQSVIAEKPSIVSRIGQRRQVIIPKRVFDELKLSTGDFVEFTSQNGHLQMRPKRLVDLEDVGLTAAEVVKVKRGETELRAGKSKSWRDVQRELR